MQKLFGCLLALLLCGSASTFYAQQIICASSCSGDLGENIFPEGDFGFGVDNVLLTDPGLAPGYTYTTAPPPLDGLYCIANSTSPWGSFAGPNWIKTGDNGPEANGYMMVVNASFQPGLFYQKTVDLCEGTPYEFSIDVISLVLSTVPNFNKPNISFLVDGNEVCETGDIPHDEEWHTVKFTFIPAPGQSSVTFALRNNAPGGFGNDLALDNIALRACGPVISIPAGSLDFCPGAPATVQANLANSPYTNPVYLWQQYLNGTWVDIPNSNTPTLIFNTPTDGLALRMLSANSMNSLASPNCRILSDSVLLHLLPSIQVSATSDSVACNGGASGSAAVLASGGTGTLTYLWSNSQTVNNISGLSAGNYLVTVADSKGCTETSSIAVGEPAALTASLSSTPMTCFESNDASATAVGSGGTGPFMYAWSNGQNLATITNLTAGNYTVTVTDRNACSMVNSLVIAQHPLVTVNTNANPVRCFGEQNGSATALGAGGIGPLTYVWSNGETSASIANLSAGNYLVTVSDGNACTAVTAINVTQPTLLNSTATATNISCAGNSDGAASISGSGGIAPYTYLWSTGSTDAGISNVQPGTYTATLTDQNGCSTTDTATVAAPAPMATIANTVDVSCFGQNNGTAQLTVSGGAAPYGFVWSNGQTGAVLNNLAAGVYAVTITDKNACTQTASLTINTPTLLTSTSSATAVNCFGGNEGAAIATGAGGTPPYAYIWNNGQTTAALNNLSAGNYTYTLTDAKGCISTGQVDITQPTALTLQSASQDAVCFGNADGQASVQISGGVSPYQYIWNNGQTTSQNNGLSAGNYQVTITDTKGCSMLGNVVVNQPNLLMLAAVPSPVSCFGGNDGAIVTQTTGGIAPYTYQWQNGMSGPNQTNLPAGAYLLTVSDANACTQTVQANIPQPSLISSTSVQAGEILCQGEASGAISVAVSGGTTPYAYQWSNGATTSAIGSLIAGAYTLTILDGNGCTATTSVQITEPAALTLQTDIQDISCPGDADGALTALPAGGIPPYAFLWSTGESTAQIEGLESGEYGVSLTDANGCTFSTIEDLSDPRPHTVSLGEDLLISLGDSIHLEAELNISLSEVQDFTWSGSADSLFCNDCYGYSFQPIKAGCEQVLVRTTKGCLATDQVCFTISEQRGIYAPNAFSPNEDGSNDFFTLFSDASVKEILTLSVYNRWGELVYQTLNLKTNDPNTGWNGTFKGQNLSLGVYLWIAQLEFIDGEKKVLSGDVTLVR